MRKKDALLIIDVQMAMFNSLTGSSVHDSERVLETIHQLLERARDTNTPVVFIQHTDNSDPEYAADTPTWQIHPHIAPRGEEKVIRKSVRDAFHETTLHDELQQMGIKGLVIVGMQTDYCVDATSRRAASLGYKTIVVEDAHTTFDTPERTAQEIVDHHNRAWSAFAQLVKAGDIEVSTKPTPKPVYVVEYDATWPAIFSSLKEEIAPVLGEVAIVIEHMGSTSVHGLAAKPVIDMNIVVRRDDVPKAIELLATLGYAHVGNQGIVDREAFKYSSNKPAHHLYVSPEDSAELHRQILFRDYLRANPEVAQQYGELKKRLAEQYRNDRVAYTDAKTEFILGTLQKATVERIIQT